MQPHIRNWCTGYCDIWKDRSENVVLLCGYKYSGGLSRFLLDLCRASWSWCPAQRTRKLRKERILKCWWVPRYDKACLFKVKILVTILKFWPLFVRSLFRSDHFHPWSALKSMRSHLPPNKKNFKTCWLFNPTARKWNYMYVRKRAMIRKFELCASFHCRNLFPENIVAMTFQVVSTF